MYFLSLIFIFLVLIKIWLISYPTTEQKKEMKKEQREIVGMTSECVRETRDREKPRVGSG